MSVSPIKASTESVYSGQRIDQASPTVAKTEAVASSHISSISDRRPGVSLWTWAAVILMGVVSVIGDWEWPSKP